MTWYEWAIFGVRMVNGGLAIVNAYYLLMLWDHCGNARRVVGLVVVFFCAHEFIKAILGVMT